MTTLIKSFSVGNGDMYYIEHDSDNFTIIDCNLHEENRESIVKEIIKKSENKSITRFISSHPDEDHLRGLEYLDEKRPLYNFYCVENNATKDEETDDFKTYCKFRDSDKAYYIYKECERRWMNKSNDERDHSGIDILWPNTNNGYFLEALDAANSGESPNNISPIIQWSSGEARIMWMGDLETDFMENIVDDLDLNKVSILFAPHHGRDSGKVPSKILDMIHPSLIVIGEAPSKHLNYYPGYNVLTQNSAGSITFMHEGGYIHIFVENKNYSVDFLENRRISTIHGYYIGSLFI